MSRGEFDAGHSEAQIGKAGQRQANPRRWSVHGGNYRLIQAKVIGKGRIEVLISAEARLGDICADTRVIATPICVAAERLAIAADTKTSAAAADDDRPHGGIAIRSLKQVAIFGMQPARPRIHAMRPVQPNDGDALAVYLVLGVFQLHGQLPLSQQIREGSCRPAR